MRTVAVQIMIVLIAVASAVASCSYAQEAKPNWPPLNTGNVQAVIINYATLKSPVLPSGWDAELSNLVIAFLCKELADGAACNLTANTTRLPAMGDLEDLECTIILIPEQQKEWVKKLTKAVEQIANDYCKGRHLSVRVSVTIKKGAVSQPKHKNGA